MSEKVLTSSFFFYTFSNSFEYSKFLIVVALEEVGRVTDQFMSFFFLAPKKRKSMFQILLFPFLSILKEKWCILKKKKNLMTHYEAKT